MVFIVEMWWGRPSELVVQNLDEHGDLCPYVVKLEGPPDPERRTFSCHADNWEAAQELGRAFGWLPKGSLFRLYKDESHAVREAGYNPDNRLVGFHEVEADDARAWAAALERCAKAIDDDEFQLPTRDSAILLREGMTLNQFRQANRGLTVQFLRAFAGFMSKGPFRFDWDD